MPFILVRLRISAILSILFMRFQLNVLSIPIISEFSDSGQRSLGSGFTVTLENKSSPTELKSLSSFEEEGIDPKSYQGSLGPS